MSNKTPGDTDTGMSKEEWLSRYRERLVDYWDFDEVEAETYSNLGEFAEMVDGFEDDPEGAADEEMSYAD